MTTRLQLQDDDHHDNQALTVRGNGSAMNLRYASRAASTSSQEPDDVLFVMQYLRILWKHKWVLFLSLVVGSLVGLGISLWMTPMYSATATMEIQNVQEPFTSGLLASRTDPTLTTHSQLLSSRTMRLRVIKKLLGKPAGPLPEVKEPLDPVRKLLRLSEPLKTVSTGEAIGTASGTLNVTVGKDSRILNLSTNSPNPQTAADFINTLAQEYIDRSQEDRWESYQNTNEQLTRAQAQLKAKFEESERRAADFLKSRKLIFAGKNDNISEEKLKQLGGALSQAQADRISRQSVYESSLSPSQTESLPAVLDNGPMAQYQIKIADLRRELAQQSETLTPAHYKLKQIQAQIKELEDAREKERTNVLSRIKIEFEAAQKKEDRLKHEFESQYGVLSSQADDLIVYNQLLSEAESNKKLYEATLMSGKEASLASIMRANNARVVDAARVNVVPHSPNVSFNMTMSMLTALMCAVAIVIVRSRSDLRIQVPGVLGVQLNLRELGIIPAAKTDPALRRLLRGFGAGKHGDRTGRTMLGDGDKSPEDCLELVTWSRKPSVIAEAFRATMTSVVFSEEDGERPRVLLFTSPSPREGKSTIVCNLAIALAEINHRVLLIDADMRLPRLHTIFDVPNTFGLSDILHERTAIEDYADESLVRKTSIPGLHLLPAGPARTNLSRLLYSARTIDLIRRFRRSFDTILIDSPPVLSVPDARILARASDAVVLVVRAHQTQQEAAFAAVKCFEEDGRKILGTILNDWNPHSSSNGSYGTYGGYYPYGVYDSQYFHQDQS